MQSTTDKMAQLLFQSIDNKDTETFLSFLADDVSFRFGNASPVTGKTAVGKAVSGFFSSIKAVHHELTASWKEADAVICHGMVTYTRHDSTGLSVPFANILIMDKAQIKNYMIFVDISDLYK